MSADETTAPPGERPARRPPPGRRGGFGRQKGTPNKATAELKGAVSRFLNDPAYQDNLMKRIEDGRADHMEKYFWEYVYGRPKFVLEVERPASPTKALAEAMEKNLTKEEQLQLYALTKRAITGAAQAAKVIEVKSLPAAAEKKRARGEAQA